MKVYVLTRSDQPGRILGIFDTWDGACARAEMIVEGDDHACGAWRTQSHFDPMPTAWESPVTVGHAVTWRIEARAVWSES